MNEIAIVQKIFEDKLGEKPIRIEKITLGFLNNVYGVILSDGEFVIRISTEGHNFISYEKNLRILEKLELPVPKVILIEDTKNQYGATYIVLSRIEGNDLRFEIEKMSEEEMSILAEKVVFYQNRVMSLPIGRSFGRANINEDAEYESWNDFIKESFTKLADITSKVIDKEKLDKINILIEKQEAYFNTVKATPFMDEIGLRNVMIKDGKLKGFIDFDWICYGDPLYLVGLVQTGALAHLDKKCMYYVEELCRMMSVSNIERKVIDVYSLIYALEFISFQMKIGNYEIINNLIQRIELLMKKF